MYALLEVWNSEQDANFVWLWDRALGEAGNEGKCGTNEHKALHGGKRNKPCYEGQKDGGRLMKVAIAWEIRGESWETAMELVEGARGVYQGGEFGA